MSTGLAQVFLRVREEGYGGWRERSFGDGCGINIHRIICRLSHVCVLSELGHQIADIVERILNQKCKPIFQRFFGAWVWLERVIVGRLGLGLDPLGGLVAIGVSIEGTLGRGLQHRVQVEAVEDVCLLLDAYGHGSQHGYAADRRELARVLQVAGDQAGHWKHGFLRTRRGHGRAEIGLGGLSHHGDFIGT